jgi:hypothetical protein
MRPLCKGADQGWRRTRGAGGVELGQGIKAGPGMSRARIGFELIVDNPGLFARGRC